MSKTVDEILCYNVGEEPELQEAKDQLYELMLSGAINMRDEAGFEVDAVTTSFINEVFGK